ncbi:MAG: OmpA/MotB family protein [Oribacterium sp.]
MKKRGGGDDAGGNWMDTYGDLVTLLMTFFVLLYSMSTVDSQKWDLFVQSIYPNGRPGDKTAEQIILNAPATGNDTLTELGGKVGDEKVPQNLVEEADMNQLYIQIAKALDAAGVSGVSSTRGTDYTFITFTDKAFFDGDSSVLTVQGQETLSVFCDTIGKYNDQISQVNIMGHTAQGDPARPNNPRNDRMLSVMRAAEVCIFIQGRNVVDSDKLVSIGYGQFHPVADNATAAGRAKNRRVEILIIDKGGTIRDLDEYYAEYRNGNNENKTIITDGMTEQAEEHSNEETGQPETTAFTEESTGEPPEPEGEAAPSGGAETAAP